MIGEIFIVSGLSIGVIFVFVAFLKILYFELFEEGDIVGFFLSLSVALVSMGTLFMIFGK